MSMAGSNIEWSGGMYRFLIAHDDSAQWWLDTYLKQAMRVLGWIIGLCGQVRLNPVFLHIKQRDM